MYRRKDNMKKLVIFDLDGTLLNTSLDLNICMNKALALNKLPPITLEQTKKFIGNGARLYAERAVGNRTDLTDKVLEDYNRIYDSCKSENTTLYPGVGEMLKKLKAQGVKIAIVSNKPQSSTDEVYKNLLKEYNFDFVYGHRDNFNHKPSPDCVNYVLDLLKIDREDAVYVGDSEVDAQTAKNCGIDFVGVLWGYRSKSVIKKAGGKYFSADADNLYFKIIYFFGRKKMKKFFNEFKAFISRGNVLDMAVGVIIGSAFTAIVTALTNGILKPFINYVIFLINGGSDNMESFYTVLNPVYTTDKAGQKVLDLANSIYIDWGAFISAIINFLLIALTVFLIVKAINKVRETLDYNEVMKKAIQKKLDADEPLNEVENKWMKRMEKKNPAGVPHKTVVEEPAPAAEPEPSSTDKLLMQILAELKENKNENK